MNKRKMEVLECWTICADPANSSCIVNAVYAGGKNPYKKANDWVKKENKKVGFEQYWVERSQLFMERR